MFRKILIALAALGAVGVAAFTVTAVPAGAASLHHRNHHEWRPAVRFYSTPATSCYVRRVVPTPFGPQLRWVNICY